MTPKRLRPVKHRKPALEPQKKACRCRGRSTGAFFWDSGDEALLVVGLLCGLRCVTVCDKCGKKWRQA